MWGLLEASEKTDPSAVTADAIATLLGVTTGWVIARRGEDPQEIQVLAAIERARATAVDQAPAPATEAA